MRHGTLSAYGRGCRCDDCRETHNAYQRDYYRRRQEQRRNSVVVHGTSTGYQNGCRCEECRNANRLRQVEWREGRRKKNDVTNVVRPVNPLDLLRPDWAADAACRGATDLFFAERGDSGTIKRAKAVCAGCPVRDECLEYGLHERFGIWGGLAPKERRGPKRARAAIAVCGTDSGYFRHRRLGEDACDACKAAHTAVSVTNDKKARQQRRRAS